MYQKPHWDICTNSVHFNLFFIKQVSYLQCCFSGKCPDLSVFTVGVSAGNTEGEQHQCVCVCVCVCVQSVT